MRRMRRISADLLWIYPSVSFASSAFPLIRVFKSHLHVCVILIACFHLTGFWDGVRVDAQTAGQGREFHETYDLAPNGTISVSNTNGNVRVTSWSENRVKVDAVKRGRQDDFARVEIQVTARPERIEIRTIYPRGRSTDVSVDYDLRVPRTADLNSLNLTNGEITLTGPLARATARSTNGSITAQEVNEMASFSSTNGSIKATKIGGELRANTTNGDVNISDVATLLNAQSINGSVNALNIKNNATAGTNNGSVRLERVGGRSIARSQNGSVLVNDAGGDVEAGGISGDITVTNARGLVTASTVSGSIIVRRAEEGVRATTVSGKVEISDAKGRIEANSVSDSISLSNVDSRGVVASCVSGSVRFGGTLSGDGVYNFSSHSGDVVLTLPSDSGFRLTARSNGSINTDFPCQLSSSTSSREIRCTVGKGGAEVRASSFSGSVQIKKSIK
jgi:Putative adhesin